MLLQGVLTCLWYDLGQSVQTLEQSNKMNTFFQAIFEKVSDLKEDFGVKRFMLGLTSFLVNSEMPHSVRKNYAIIMKTLTFLSSKSIELRHKAREGTSR